MSYFKVISIFLATVAVLAVSIIGFGCANNTESTLAAPEFEEPEAPPIEVTIDQIYTEYMADEAAADAKYKGERLLFNEVEVEEVVIQIFYLYPGVEPAPLRLYFMNGPVGFKLRDFRIVQNIEANYVLNIVGECMGLQKEYVMAKGYVIYVIIEDCWVESVIGDISTGGSLDIDPY